MSEDRLITLILWVVLILGIAGLVGIYSVRSDHRHAEAPQAIESQEKVKLPDTRIQGPPSTPVPAPEDIVTVLKDQPKKEPATSALPPPSPQVTIHETSKAKGAFSNAQDITEGVIIGSRGSVGDRADCYKVRAAGNSMVLKLEPSLKEEAHFFTMAVFDSGKRQVGESLGKTRSTATIAVTPQFIYYIKVDLSHAPIQTPPYNVHVYFHEREAS